MSDLVPVTRLVLGTAQLGFHHGINNKHGQPTAAEAHSIVAEAWRCGITEFDTAQAYGTSEAVLGQALTALGVAERARVVTKLDPALDPEDASGLDRALRRSLELLNVRRLAGLMLHHESQLAHWEKGLGGWLTRTRQEGLVEAVGVSTYSPEKALAALDTDGVRFVQVPANILDRRFESAGVFRRAQALGKTVYIRSVFLQGLLLSEPAGLPPRMAFARSAVERVHGLAERAGVPVSELCLAWVLRRHPTAKVIFGAETAAQVARNAPLALRSQDAILTGEVDSAFPDIEERIVNPILWPKE